MYRYLLSFVCFHLMLTARVSVCLTPEERTTETTTESNEITQHNANSTNESEEPNTKFTILPTTTVASLSKPRKTAIPQNNRRTGTTRKGTKNTNTAMLKLATTTDQYYQTESHRFNMTSEPTESATYRSVQPTATIDLKLNGTDRTRVHVTVETTTQLTQTASSATSEVSHTSSAYRQTSAAAADYQTSTLSVSQSTANVELGSTTADDDTYSTQWDDASYSGETEKELTTEQQTETFITGTDANVTRTQHFTESSEELYRSSTSFSSPIPQTTPSDNVEPLRVHCDHFTSSNLTFSLQPISDSVNITACLYESGNLASLVRCHSVADGNCSRNSTTVTCVYSGLIPYTTYVVNFTSTDRPISERNGTTSCRTGDGVPTQVLNLNVSRPTAGMRINIVWKKPEKQNADNVTYVIEVESQNCGKDNRKHNSSKETWTTNVTAGCAYTIKVAAKTSAGTGQFEQAVITVPHENDNSSMVIVLAVSLCILCLLLAAILLLFLLRYQPQLLMMITTGSQQNETHMIDMPSVFSNPVKLHDFPMHVKMLSKDSGLLLSEEYEALKFVGRDQPCEQSKQQCNRTKNRYTNILPYDHSRVKLIPIDDVEGCDYINANWIPGYNSRREFIATQGPMPSTRDDFWRMIWEYNCKAIVMLTLCSENNKIKCEQYWPPDGEPQFYGELRVCVLGSTTSDTWVINDMQISLGEQKRTIKHFHYVEWADMKVPDITSMLDFVRLIRAHANSKTGGPIVVHCSAGVGRTGTYIAIDTLLLQLRNDDVLDVYGVVIKLRLNRLQMVQTEQQYMFIYECLLRALSLQGRITENSTETAFTNIDEPNDNTSTESSDETSTAETEESTADQSKTFRY